MEGELVRNQTRLLSVVHLETGVRFDYAAFLHLVPLANVVKRSSAKRKDSVQIWEGTPFLKPYPLIGGDMSQELNPHLKLINGWYFDFKNMKAYRAAAWENPSFPREVEIDVRGNGTIGRRYHIEAC